jgi:hypothetical protein
MSVPASRYPDARSRLAVYDAIEDGLANLPGVRAFAFAGVLPVFPASERSIVAEGGDPRDAIPARQVSIGSRYFDVLGLGVEQGRPFASEDGIEGRQHVIVNAHLAQRLFPAGAAVGRRIAIVTPAGAASPQWQTIIGVAPVIRQRPQAEPESVVYFPLRLSPPTAASIVMRSDLPLAQVGPLLREAVRRIDPAVPVYDLATLRAAVRRAEWNARLSSSLLVTLTAIAIALAAAGLFAVMNRMVAARRREIGVRLALGASSADVARLVARDAVAYVSYGALAGLGAAVAWDAGFGTSARSQAALPGARLADPLVLLGIAAVLGAVALVASLAPLRRAVGLRPLAVLRED